MSVQERDEQHGDDPKKVGKKVVQLAMAARLPARVTVGPIFERFAVWVRRIIPDRWFEVFYRYYYHI